MDHTRTLSGFVLLVAGWAQALSFMPEPLSVEPYSEEMAELVAIQEARKERVASMEALLRALPGKPLGHWSREMLEPYIEAPQAHPLTGEQAAFVLDILRREADAAAPDWKLVEYALRAAAFDPLPADLVSQWQALAQAAGDAEVESPEEKFLLDSATGTVAGLLAQRADNDAVPSKRTPPPLPEPVTLQIPDDATPDAGWEFLIAAAAAAHARAHAEAQGWYRRILEDPALPADAAAHIPVAIRDAMAQPLSLDERAFVADAIDHALGPNPPDWARIEGVLRVVDLHGDANPALLPQLEAILRVLSATSADVDEHGIFQPTMRLIGRSGTQEAVDLLLAATKEHFWDPPGPLRAQPHHRIDPVDRARISALRAVRYAPASVALAPLKAIVGDALAFESPMWRMTQPPVTPGYEEMERVTASAALMALAERDGIDLNMDTTSPWLPVPEAYPRQGAGPRAIAEVPLLPTTATSFHHDRLAALALRGLAAAQQLAETRGAPAELRRWATMRAAVIMGGQARIREAIAVLEDWLEAHPDDGNALGLRLTVLQWLAPDRRLEAEPAAYPFWQAFDTLMEAHGDADDRMLIDAWLLAHDYAHNNPSPEPARHYAERAYAVSEQLEADARDAGRESLADTIARDRGEHGRITRALRRR